MTAAEGSYLGFAYQSSGYDTSDVGDVTDNDFKYMLFREGSIGPQNVILPLDPEVGGGSLLRSVVKAGVYSRGALDFIPRPETIGHLLCGALGADVSQATGFATVSGGVVTSITITNGGYGYTSATMVVTPVSGGSGCSATVTVSGGQVTGTTGLVGGTAYAVAPLISFTGNSLQGSTTIGYSHQFNFQKDQFAIPYYTLRSSPGGMWGETFANCRVDSLALSWRAARFLEGSVSFIGGMPKRMDATSWAALYKVDSGPQFLTSNTSTVQVVSAGDAKVLSGSIVFGNAIPLDEQWIIGKNTPDQFDMTGRSVVMTMVVKITDDALYKKFMYDPAATVPPTTWLPKVFEDGQVQVQFLSDQSAGSNGTSPYALTILADAGVGSLGNVFWSASPIGLRAGRQVLMQVTGIFTATTSTQYSPVRVQLLNKHATIYPA